MFVLWAFATFGPCLGCAGEDPSPPAFTGPIERVLAEDGVSAASTTLRGKLRDLDAAVNIALSTRDLAVLDVERTDGAGRRRYSLVGIRGEVGWIDTSFEPPGPSLAAGREEREMRLTARVGRFGDSPRERDVVQGVATHLRSLARQP